MATRFPSGERLKRAWPDANRLRGPIAEITLTPNPGELLILVRPPRWSRRPSFETDMLADPTDIALPVQRPGACPALQRLQIQRLRQERVVRHERQASRTAAEEGVQRARFASTIVSTWTIGDDLYHDSPGRQLVAK
jgi:hypothetical protein